MEATPPGSQRTNRFLIYPGIKALQAGIRHAYVASQILGKNKAPGYSYPNKKQKMAPIPGQSKKGNYKKKTTYKKKASATSVVKKTLLGMAQTYHRGITDTNIGSALISNNVYGYNLTAQVQQATTLAGRQGDQIYLIACILKGSIFTPTAAGAYQYRVIVYMSGEEYNPATLGTGPGASEIFLPNTAGTFNIHGQINSKSVTLLYDERVDINSTISAVSDVVQVDINIPLLRKFEYQSDGSAYGKKQNLYVSVISVVGGGVSGTTSTGQILLSGDIVFKNL